MLLHELDRKLRSNAMQSSCVFSSVSDSLKYVLGERESSLIGLETSRLRSPFSHIHHLQVVVTGSLHLVGAAMKVLGPSVVEI